MKLNFENLRDLSKWGKENVEYKDINDFLDRFVPKTAIHTVWAYGYPIDILFDYTPNKPTVFIWKGNTRRNKDTKMPIFVGFSMVKKADATRVSISDPTMYLNDKLGLAWYAGSPEIKFQSIISLIVKRIGDCLSNKIIHTGGSGGGFAALYFSKFNKDSLAVPFNPQTDFLDYEENAVKLFLKSTVDHSDIARAKNDLSQHLVHNLTTVYNKSGIDNYVLYLQNINDTHVLEHLTPFLASFGANLTIEPGLHVYDGLKKSVYLSNKWGDGHNPPSNDYLSAIFKLILQSDDGFNDLIQDEDMFKSLG